MSGRFGTWGWGVSGSWTGVWAGVDGCGQVWAGVGGCGRMCGRMCGRVCVGWGQAGQGRPTAPTAWWAGQAEGCEDGVWLMGPVSGPSWPVMARHGPSWPVSGPSVARQWPVSGPSWPVMARQWPVSGPSSPVMARQWPVMAWLGRGWGAAGARLGRGWGI